MSAYSSNNVRIKHKREQMDSTDKVQLTLLTSSEKYVNIDIDPFSHSKANCQLRRKQII